MNKDRIVTATNGT